MREVNCLALLVLFVGIDTAGRADEIPMPPTPGRAHVTVNSQVSLAKAVGEGFEDGAWENPSHLVPRELPGLIDASGPPGKGKGVWRRPVVYLQESTGVKVKIQCFRKGEKPPALGEAGKGMNANSQPAAPWYEPNYEYKAIEFHDL